ncbi:hypothetical protein TRVL_03927 [Trypanosoma vivax]|nr:hypothetical protein TRVL_03927 [Trypanosoma vivax]
MCALRLLLRLWRGTQRCSTNALGSLPSGPVPHACLLRGGCSSSLLLHFRRSTVKQRAHSPASYATFHVLRGVPVILSVLPAASNTFLSALLCRARFVALARSALRRSCAATYKRSVCSTARV